MSRQFFVANGLVGSQVSLSDTDYHMLLFGGTELVGVSPGGTGTGLPTTLTPVVLGVGRTYQLLGFPTPTYLNERLGISGLFGGVFSQTPEIDFLAMVEISISANAPALNITPLDTAVNLGGAATVDTLYLTMDQIWAQVGMAITTTGTLIDSNIYLAAAVTLAIINATLQESMIGTATLSVAAEATTFDTEIHAAAQPALTITVAADLTARTAALFETTVTGYVFVNAYLTTADNPQYTSDVKWYRSTDLDSLVPDDAQVTGPICTANNLRVLIIQKEDPPPDDGAVLRQLKSTNNINFTEGDEIQLALGTEATSSIILDNDWILIGLQCTAHGTAPSVSYPIGKFAILSQDGGVTFTDVYPTGYAPANTQSWAKVNGFINVGNGHLIAYGEFYPVEGQYHVTGDERYSIIGYQSRDYGVTWGEPIQVTGTPDGAGTIFEHCYGCSGAYMNGAIMIGTACDDGRPAIWVSYDDGVTWLAKKPASTWANHRVGEIRDYGSGGFYGLTASQSSASDYDFMFLVVGFFKSYTDTVEDLALNGTAEELAAYVPTQYDGHTFMYVWRSTDRGQTWEDLSEQVHAQIDKHDNPDEYAFTTRGWVVKSATRGYSFLMGLDGEPDEGEGGAIHFFSNDGGETWRPCTYDTGVFPAGTGVVYSRFAPGTHVALAQRRVTNNALYIYDDLTDGSTYHFFLRANLALSNIEATIPTPTGGYHLGLNQSAQPRISLQSFASGGYIFGGAAPVLSIPKYIWPATVDPPDYPLEERSKRAVLRSPVEDGKVYTRARWVRRHRIFHLHWEVLPTTQKDTIATFFEAIHGGATAFDWTHPLTAVTYTVRLVSDSYTAQLKGPNVWAVAFDIEEL